MMEYSKDNPLKVVTLFSGYDSQCMALEMIRCDNPGFDYALVAWCEIDRDAINAHNAVFPQYADRNLGDISAVDWGKMAKNTQHIDLLTYSSPCQDISNAGRQRGLEKGSGTRSSLLWEVERAVDALRPRMLFMENVKALVSQKFMPGFQAWIDLLAAKGYTSFWHVMDSARYGVPQHRERVFMASFLDQPRRRFYAPAEMELDKCIADVLEENVDQSFFLTRDKVEKVLAHCDRQKLHAQD